MDYKKLNRRFKIRKYKNYKILERSLNRLNGLWEIRALRLSNKVIEFKDKFDKKKED